MATLWDLWSRAPFEDAGRGTSVVELRFGGKILVSLWLVVGFFYEPVSNSFEDLWWEGLPRLAACQSRTRVQPWTQIWNGEVWTGLLPRLSWKLATAKRYLKMKSGVAWGDVSTTWDSS